jgi:shikimate kinase / 3-dehydroquinate synthase
VPRIERAAVQRIVLVGFMGAGKTTIGKRLARRLGWGFRDMDREIEAGNGLTVAEIFARHGEAFFRAEELRVAREMARLMRHVVAAGGGAFASAETRDVLRTGAAVVWLRCDLDTLLGRIPPDGSRPLASNRETMAALLAEREPTYRQADLIVDASDATAAQVARRIARVLVA